MHTMMSVALTGSRYSCSCLAILAVTNLIDECDRQRFIFVFLSPHFLWALSQMDA